MPPRRRPPRVAPPSPPAAPSSAAAAPREDATGALAGKLRAGLVAFAVLAAGLVAAHIFLGEAAVVGRMAAAFEAGGARAWWWGTPARGVDAFRAKDANARVPRPDLVASLTALLRPDSADTYALVVGVSGTGKSTAVRAAVRALPLPARHVESFFSARAAAEAEDASQKAAPHAATLA